MPKNVQSNFIHTLHKLERTQISINRRINCGIIHIKEGRKKNELLIYAATRANFKINMLSERSQTQNNTCRRILFM